MEKLLEVLKKALPTVDFGDGENLISGGKIDSLGVINIVMTIGEEYGVMLDPEDISVKNFDSVENIRRLIECRQKDS